jgi:hypothetical protein
MSQTSDPQDADGRPRTSQSGSAAGGTPPRGAGPVAFLGRTPGGFDGTQPSARPAAQRPVAPSRSARSFEQVRAAAENARRDGRSGPFSDEPSARADGTDPGGVHADAAGPDGVDSVDGADATVHAGDPGADVRGPSTGGPVGWTPGPPDALLMSPAVDPDLAAIGYIGGGGLTDAIVAANRGGYAAAGAPTHPTLPAPPGQGGAHVAELRTGTGTAAAREQAGAAAAGDRAGYAHTSPATPDMLPPGDVPADGPGPVAGTPRGNGTAGRDGPARASGRPPDGGRNERGARRGQGSMGPAGARALGNKVVGPGTGPIPARGGRGRPDVGGRSGGRRDQPESAGTPIDDDTATDAVGSARPPDPAAAEPPPGGPQGTLMIGTGADSIPAWLVVNEAATGEQINLTAAFAPPYRDPFDDTSPTALVQPVRDDDEYLHADGPAPSLVRPYSRTGGRTRPGHALDLEALVVTTVNGREAWSSPLLTPEHVQVIGMCVDTTSVAEIAARLTVPIGVARVIIADMVDLGLVEVMKTSANLGDERDPAFLRRVLSGLQRL